MWDGRGNPSPSRSWSQSERPTGRALQTPEHPDVTVPLRRGHTARMRSAALAGPWLLVAAAMLACGGELSAPGPGDAGGRIATNDAGNTGACISAGGPASEPAPEVEAGTCVNGWQTSDPGCPCDESVFSPSCPVVGTRCYVPSHSVDAITMDLQCVSQPNGPASWAEYRIYSPFELLLRPSQVFIDTSDCESRPASPCSCSPGEPTEAWLGTQVHFSCPSSPALYLVFNDAGCPSEVHFETPPDITTEFALCLRANLGGVRWACASSGTRLVIPEQTLMRPNVN